LHLNIGTHAIRRSMSLRFTSDGESPGLTRKGAGEDFSEDAIKGAVKNWRSENSREKQDRPAVAGLA